MKTDSYIKENGQFANWKFNFFDFEGLNKPQDQQCVQTSFSGSGFSAFRSLKK
jgi:hypothetical protein